MNNEKEQFRVVIDREANDALEAFVGRLNSDPLATKLSKSDVANYLLQCIDRHLKESEIAEIRAIHFDPKKALEGLLRAGDDLPQNLREAVLKHCGIKPVPKGKQAKKLSTPVLVDNAG